MSNELQLPHFSEKNQVADYQRAFTALSYLGKQKYLTTMARKLLKTTKKGKKLL